MFYTFEKPHEMMFMGMYNGQRLPDYPCWLYKEGADPVLCSDSAYEKQLRAEGYDSITAAAMSNRSLVNWFWDLEDMSPKQLCVFAKEEYGVDLPIQAGQEKLFKSVCELTRFAPQNENRLVMMAHTMAMNLDATMEEIKRMQLPGINGVVKDVQTFEVWA